MITKCNAVILYGKSILDRGASKHPQAKNWLVSWEAAVIKAEWTSILEVRESFPSADGIPIGRGKSRVIVTCFNVGGNDFRLITRIGYAEQVVLVLAVLTHAEYSADHWKKKLQ